MHFTKMQGAGNDFIVLNNMELKLNPAGFPAMARRLCTRGLSIGANALMVADFPEGSGDFQMRFYNADGTVAEMCGNGARCIARYAYERGFARESMRIETVAGEVLAWREERRLYRILLNAPSVVELEHPLPLEDKVFEGAYIELGDPGIPHAVVPYPGLAEKSCAELRTLGAALRWHPSFPKGANVNFYDIMPDGTVTEKTFERGVEDFTLACGTGSGSTALALVLSGRLSGPRVQLTVPGGVLWVEVRGAEHGGVELYLIGDTNIVAEGEITDEDLCL